MEGHAAVVATLLAQGALVDKADNEGSAPLHAAAAMGHEAVVEKLLAHGAGRQRKPELRFQGLTALEIAERQGHAGVVAVLTAK